MQKPSVLYHGSSKKLVGSKLNPSWGDDSEERPENNLFAVYATDKRDTAIVMAMFSCKDVIGGSLDGYKNGKLIARIHGGYPKQEFVYVHHLPADTFEQTKINKHQFVSLVPVKVIKTEKVRVSEYHHLARLATKDETDDWIKKYGTKKTG